MKDRIGIIGAGQVGSETANELLRDNVGDCVLIDIQHDSARARALDLTHSAPVRHSAVSISAGRDLEALRGCRVIVIAAGSPRRPGMTRDDLLDVNYRTITGIAQELAGIAPDAVWIVVTNPLDAMVYTALRASGKDRATVIGMAGALDSARFRALIAAALGVSPQDVQAMVLGSHGDLMVPLVRFATIAGIPAIDLLTPDELIDVVSRTTNAGTELVNLLKNGSAWFAAGASVASMVDAVIHDSKRVVCSCVMCTGEYGINGVCVGVPVVLGAAGAERIIELKLTADERRALLAATERLRSMQQRVDRLRTSSDA